MNGDPASGKRKDVDTTAQAQMTMLDAKDSGVAVACAGHTDDGSHAAELLEVVPYIDDIPEILVDEEEDDSTGSTGTTDKSGRDTQGSPHGQTANAPVASAAESLNINRQAEAQPVVAAKDDDFEDGNRTFVDFSDDEVSDYEWRTELNRLVLRTKLKKRLSDDKELMDGVDNSLLNCRLIELMDNKTSMNLWHELGIVEMAERGWNQKDQVCRSERKLARPFVAHLPEKQQMCRHMHPIRLFGPSSTPRAPVKLPSRKKNWRHRANNPRPSKLSICVSAENLAAPPERIPFPSSIDISDAYNPDGQLVEEGRASDVECPGHPSGMVDASSPAVNASSPTVAELTGQDKEAAPAGHGVQGEEPAVEKITEAEACGTIDDYPEIPSEDDDAGKRPVRGSSREPPRRTVAKRSWWPVWWEDTEQTTLWSLLPGIFPPPM